MAILLRNQVYLRQLSNAVQMQVQQLVSQRTSSHWCSSSSRQSRPLPEARLGWKTTSSTLRYRRPKINLCDEVVAHRTTCLPLARHSRCCLAKVHVLHSCPCQHKRKELELPTPPTAPEWTKTSMQHKQPTELRGTARPQTASRQDLCEWCLPSGVTK